MVSQGPSVRKLLRPKKFPSSHQMARNVNRESPHMSVAPKKPGNPKMACPVETWTKTCGLPLSLSHTHICLVGIDASWPSEPPGQLGLARKRNGPRETVQLVVAFKGTWLHSHSTTHHCVKRSTNKEGCPITHFFLFLFFFPCESIGCSDCIAFQSAPVPSFHLVETPPKKRKKKQEQEKPHICPIMVDSL